MHPPLPSPLGAIFALKYLKKGAKMGHGQSVAPPPHGVKQNKRVSNTFTKHLRLTDTVAYIDFYEGGVHASSPSQDQVTGLQQINL